MSRGFDKRIPELARELKCINKKETRKWQNRHFWPSKQYISIQNFFKSNLSKYASVHNFGYGVGKKMKANVSFILCQSCTCFGLNAQTEI